MKEDFMSLLKRYRLAITVIGLMVVAIVALIAIQSSQPSAADQEKNVNQGKMAAGKVDMDSTTRVILKTSNHSLKNSLASKEKLKKIKDLTEIDATVYEIPSDTTALEVSDRVNAALEKETHGNPDKNNYAEVDALVPAGLIPNDPGYTNQWYLPKVSAPGAWDTTTGKGEVTIAILDTGVACDPTNGGNQDLNGQCVAGRDFVNDPNGRAGGNVDVQGHGTAVAGVAAATANNSLGISGTVWNAKIMPVQIAFNNNGEAWTYWSTLAQGMYWAVDNGAKVLNASYVGLAGSSTIINAAAYVNSKGGVFFACAGNDNTNPGYSNDSNTIIVSGTDSNDNRASFSDFGAFVDIAAPATYMYTTNRGATSYGYWQGTSFSSPLSAGVAALAWATAPSLTNSQVKSLLFNNVDDKGTVGWDQYFGYGRVNAQKVVAAAKNLVGAPDTTAPTAPTNLTATATSSSEIYLTWTASTDDVGVASYQVYRNNAKVATTTSPRYTDTGLLAATPYSYYVTAADAAGNVSGPSNTATKTTLNEGLSFVLGPSVSAKTANSATISWTTNKAATAVIKYGTSKNNLNLSASAVTAATSQSVTLTGLTKGTAYYYIVTVTASDGTTASSVRSSFRTKNR